MKSRLWILALFLLAASLPAQDAADPRRILVTPDNPRPGDPVVFTAEGFHTPQMLKWDLGDGTVLTVGQQLPPAENPRITHVFLAAGTYTIRVFDWNGSPDKPPVTRALTVTAAERSIKARPLPGQAGGVITLTAFNFFTPSRIVWDFGDGSTAVPGDPAMEKPSFQVTHRYAQPGTYQVQAFDWNGDRTRPPVSLPVEIQPAAEAPTVAAPVSAPSATPPPPVDPASPSVITVQPPADDTPAETPPRQRKAPVLKIGPMAGYFLPKDAMLKKIYGEGDVLYGVRIGVRVWRFLSLWGQAAQYQVTGKTTFTSEQSTLTIRPFSLLARFAPERGTFRPYLGAGLVYATFREESSIGTVKGNGQGPMGQVGLELVASRHFTFDLGASYHKVTVSPTGFDIDLGGLAGGLALLITF